MQVSTFRPCRLVLFLRATHADTWATSRCGEWFSHLATALCIVLDGSNFSSAPQGCVDDAEASWQGVWKGGLLTT